MASQVVLPKRSKSTMDRTRTKVKRKNFSQNKTRAVDTLTDEVKARMKGKTLSRYQIGCLHWLVKSPDGLHNKEWRRIQKPTFNSMVYQGWMVLDKNTDRCYATPLAIYIASLYTLDNQSFLKEDMGDIDKYISTIKMFNAIQRMG